MQHHERAVSDQGIDFGLRLRQLHAQRGIHFIAHAGVAVLYVISVGCPVTPDALQIPGQAARRRHNHRIRRKRFIEYAQHATLGQRGVGYLAKFPIHRLAIESIIDFRDKSLFLPDGLIDALGLFQLAALDAVDLRAPARLPAFAGQRAVQ